MVILKAILNDTPFDVALETLSDTFLDVKAVMMPFSIIMKPRMMMT